MIRSGPIVAVVFTSLIFFGQAQAQRHGGFSGGGNGRAGMVQSGSASQAPTQGQVSGGRAGASMANGPVRAQGARRFVGSAPANPPSAPLFPNALGNNVGLQAFPPVATPGIGNINQPGLPPGTPTMMPNVNNPAGPFGIPQPFPRPGGHPGEHRGRRSGGVVYIPYYYAVPYVPYYYEPEAPPPAESAPAPEQPAEPAPSHGSGAPRLYYVPPEVTGEQPGQPPAAPEVPQSATIPVPAAPQAKTVTLLAFKDKTLVAVTDYWLKGDALYYLRNGAETGIPLDQLDFPLTQQLNYERHVPFILESRP